MYKYSRNLELIYETPSSIPHEFTPEKEQSALLIDSVVKDNRLVLTEYEAKKLLSYYGIPTMTVDVAKTPEEAMEKSLSVGFPAVMKIMSPDILHKTDIGGVKLNIDTKEKAKEAFRQIMDGAKKHHPDADIHGV